MVGVEHPLWSVGGLTGEGPSSPGKLILFGQESIKSIIGYYARTVLILVSLALMSQVLPQGLNKQARLHHESKLFLNELVFRIINEATGERVLDIGGHRGEQGGLRLGSRGHALLIFNNIRIIFNFIVILLKCHNTVI